MILRHALLTRARDGIALLMAGCLLLHASGCALPSASGGDGGRSEVGSTEVGESGREDEPGYGELDEPLSPFDDAPAITNLSDDLRSALQQAATEAAARDIPLVVTSGWRGTEYQQELFDDAVRTYGSEEEAMKWVLPPDLTTHVTGDAVDVGYTDGADWLGRFGNRWGLCQPFSNEIWHVELLTTPGGSCPEQLNSSADRSR